MNQTQKDLKKEQFEVFQGGLLQNPTALEYLKKRGIEIEPGGRPQNAGLFGYDNGKIIIYHETPDAVYLIDHNFQDSTNPKYKFPFNMQKDFPFNLYNIPPDKTYIYLTEGIFDALYLEKKHDLPAVALLGSELKENTIKHLKGFESIILALDNDKAGLKARERIFNQLKEKGFNNISFIDYKNFKHKDINDAYQAGDLESIDAVLNNLKEGILLEKNLFQFLTEKYDREKDRTAEILGFPLTRFKEICKNTDGIQPGFYVISAGTNVGKTAFLVNLLWDIMKTSFDNFTEGGRHVSGLYISLDDTKNIIVNRFISSLSGVPINTIQRKINNAKQEADRDKAYKDLKELSKEKLLNILDASDIKDINELEKKITETVEKNQEQDRETVIVIDALQNLTTGDFDSQREANIERANRIKNICDRLNVAIMTTVEILKREQNERPTLSSIMESGKYGYNASLVWALWEDPNGPQDDPERINLQLIYLKNKLSFFKGFQTLLFEKSVSKMTEIETHDFQMKPEKQNKKEHGKKKNDY